MREKRKATPIRRSAVTRAPKLTVAQAVDRGDPREVLVAMKRRLAAAMTDASPRDLAPLSRHLLKVTAEIDALDQAAEEAAAKAAGGEAEPSGSVVWDEVEL